jgi:hypothetical protein
VNQARSSLLSLKSQQIVTWWGDSKAFATDSERNR